MHHLIIGQTKSGKTELAKIMAEQWSRQKPIGDGLVMYIDLTGGDWPSLGGLAESIPDPDVAIDRLKKTLHQLVIVDESEQSLDKYEKQHNWLATYARHLGHSCVFLAQRPQQLSKTIRTQCESWWIFRTMSFDDSRTIYRDSGCRYAIDYAHRLKRFYGIRHESFKIDEYFICDINKRKINFLGPWPKDYVEPDLPPPA